MTPRELVKQTLRFEPTPRLPRQVWAGPLAQNRYPDELAALLRDFPEDICGPQFTLPPIAGVCGNADVPGTYVDEWGCAFVNLEPYVMGEVVNPQIADWSNGLGGVQPPWSWVDIDRAEVNRSCAATDRFVALLAPIRPFERMQFLRGTENVLMDLLLNRDALCALRDLIHEWAVRLLQSWVQTDIDGIVWYDDWGSQSALLIDPGMWRELFRPLYADYVDIIHGAGKFAFMHSDGHIRDILDDLIDVGVDAVNTQLFCMDIEELGRRFAGRITFWGEIDRQHVLAFGTEAETRAAVRRVARALYRGRGGVIAQCEFGPGARPQNVRAVFDEWQRVGAEYHR